MSIRIEIADGRAFRPGETVRGTVSWELDREPESVALRLFWYTSGKGTRDVEIVDEVEFEIAQQRHSEEFSFQAPLSPYSFSGSLISLIWAIEAVVQPGGESVREEIIISPTGTEVRLNAYDEEPEADEDTSEDEGVYLDKEVAISNRNIRLK